MLTEEVFDRLEQLEAAARARQRTLLQPVLLALLEQPVVVFLIVGVKRIDQLEDLLRQLPTSWYSPSPSDKLAGRFNNYRQLHRAFTGFPHFLHRGWLY